MQYIVIKPVWTILIHEREREREGERERERNPSLTLN
jgi:hypothetical protein